jgi:hypothetical protein
MSMAQAELQALRAQARMLADETLQVMRTVARKRLLGPYLGAIQMAAIHQAQALGYGQLQNAATPRSVVVRPEEKYNHAYVEWNARSQEFPRMLEEEAQEIGNVMLAEVKDLSMRRFYTLAELAELGHPYSTRLPVDSAGVPDYVINYQSGEYFAGWRMLVRMLGKRLQIGIWNIASYAKYLHGGTERMRARPIAVAATERTKDARRQVLDRVRHRLARRGGGRATMVNHVRIVGGPSNKLGPAGAPGEWP